MNTAGAFRLLALVAIVVMMSGCATIRGWFEGDEEPDAPAELVEFEPEIDVGRIWRTDTGAGVDKSGRQLWPAYSQGSIYVADFKGRLSALESESGNQRWSIKTDLAFSGGPAVEGQQLVMGTIDGVVVAYDALDGSELWRATVSSEVLARPAIADGSVVVRCIDGRVFAFEAASGERRWVYDRSVPLLSLRGNGSPLVRGGAVFIGYDGGEVVALRLADGDLLWESVVVSREGRTELERLADVDGQMVLVASDLIVASYKARVASLAANSGQLLWFKDISSASGVSVDRTNLAVADAEGTLWLLDRRNGTTVWSSEQLARRGLTLPVFYGSLVVVGDAEGYLHWYTLEDGRLVARERIGSAFAAPPMTIGNTLYALDQDGELSAWRAGAALR